MHSPNVFSPPALHRHDAKRMFDQVGAPVGAPAAARQRVAAEEDTLAFSTQATYPLPMPFFYSNVPWYSLPQLPGNLNSISTNSNRTPLCLPRGPRRSPRSVFDVDTATTAPPRTIIEDPSTQEEANLNHYYKCAKSDTKLRNQEKKLKELFDDSEAKKAAAMMDETKPLNSGTTSKRQVDVQKLAAMLESQLKFTYHRRKPKTIATAHAEALFNELSERNGYYFDAVQNEAKSLMRRRYFPAWKIQKEIDLETGGLNYEAVVE